MASDEESEKTESRREGVKKARIRSEFDALGAELEVSEYGTNDFGQSRRKISRQQSKVRTIKRKSLEIEDEKAAAIKPNLKKRLRGSRAALEDEVIQGSLIFGKGDSEEDNDLYNNNSGEDERSEERGKDYDEIHLEQEGEEESSDEEGRYELYADELNIDIEDDGDSDSESKGLSTKKSLQTSLVSKTKAPKSKFSGTKIAKTMYRLKNFKSYRLSMRHGAALGAHARGCNRSAVDELRGVATAAPVAPQVYSSLGLVYESMLRDETMKSKRKLDGNDKKGRNDKNEGAKDFEVSQLGEETEKEKEARSVLERIALANKTFGSYHIAALLCKMDHSLWMRAGDAATATASLHSRCLNLPPILNDVEPEADPETEMSGDHTNRDEETHSSSGEPTKHRITSPEEYVKFHQTERIRWLEEAKEDYQTADNLHPPGINIPAKLAFVHMELGNISEALTILTDLKNKSQLESANMLKAGKRHRTELERSFSAWLLYADLMLIIGHECKQWNRGIHTNGNYMFRRWLRKYSDTFNWQERRLQALCMAFEAAAGTKACEKLVKWTQERARRINNNSGENAEEKTRWQVCDDYDTKTPGSSRKDVDEEKSDEQIAGDEKESPKQVAQLGNTLLMNDCSLDLQRLTTAFDSNRLGLLASNQEELQEFDALTSEIAVKDGPEAVEREEQRKLLVFRHRQSLISLAGKYQEKRKALLSRQSNEGGTSERISLKDLPVSASCGVVCDIAAQLVKLCLAMKLHLGGRLAAESVSYYLQQRASRYEKRIAKWEHFERRQKDIGRTVLQLSREVYDQISEDSDSSSGDESDILTDDELFDSPEGKQELLMMKKGILNSELRLLYGLCLISEDKLDYLAMKMVSSIKDLKHTNDKELELLANQGTSDDVSLHLFRRAMTEPMSKLDAFAFTADVLNKLGKEEEWSNALQPLFQNYLEELEELNVLDSLNESPATLSIFMSMKRSNLVKIMFSTLRMKLISAKSMALSADTTEGGVFSTAYDLSLSVVDDIYRFQDSLWRTKADGNPIPDAIEVLHTLSFAFTIAMMCWNKTDTTEKSRLLSLLDRLKKSVCIICNVDVPNHNNIHVSRDSIASESWRHFPVPSDWQSDSLSVISRSAFNFCVGTTVSTFSGWEKDEFTLKLLKKNRSETFFGVRLGCQVAGFLGEEKELMLSQQWSLLEALIPTLSPIHFTNSVNDARKIEWCKKVIELKKERFKDFSISCFGEDNALNVLLIFSHVNLLLAEREENETKAENLLKSALSIVLPMSQFCLDQSLWDSEIGTRATDDEKSEWQVFADSETKTSSKDSRSQKKSSNVKSQAKQKEREPRVLSRQSVKSPIMKLVKVPAHILLREWNGKETFDESDEDDDIIDSRLNKWSNNISGPAKLAMKKLDYCIRKLRQCSTINSLQKASLQVSMSLLDIASKKECRNPFLCLNQASVFASQGPKGGNNDEDFKKPLPRQADCTAEEAIHILGRADCLRAIHFTDEAMFLCSFVAKVCCLHRDKKQPYHLWTPKWRVVGIMTYTISVAIDSIIHSLMQGDARNDALESWEKAVRAEIGRGRSDAIAMHKAFGRATPTESHHAVGESGRNGTMDANSEEDVNEDNHVENNSNDSGESEGDDYSGEQEDQVSEIYDEGAHELEPLETVCADSSMAMSQTIDRHTLTDMSEQVDASYLNLTALPDVEMKAAADAVQMGECDTTNAQENSYNGIPTVEV